MNIKDRIQAFTELGKQLKTIDSDAFTTLTDQIMRENPWFTENNVKLSLTGISTFLNDNAIQQWVSEYSFVPEKEARTVALVLAGNIPLVGFHDILTVLMSGHKALIKPSSKDSVLTSYITKQLTEIEPRFNERIIFTERLSNFDAVIATGSDNSSRYFQYYFEKYPHIIRKNRSSVAIITGKESADDIALLGQDIFSYFGLGCRNVSKIYVPHGYDPTSLLPHWNSHENIIHHHKYCNNYDYQKAIMLVNTAPFFDNGFVLLVESDKMVSPISVVFYEYYQSQQELTEKLNTLEDKIQCIAGNAAPATIPFGQTQLPTLQDYADGVDTMKFLLNLN